MPWDNDCISPDTLRCKMHDPEYKYSRYYDLIGAVNERCAAAGLSTLDVPVYLDLWPDIRIAVQNKVTAMIPYFVKEQDPDKDFTGETEIPLWTEADVLETIELPRIPAAVSCDIPLWLHQQYRIINLLRWVFKNGTWSDWYTRRVHVQSFNNPLTWAQAEAAWLLEPWQPGYIFDPPELSHYAQYIRRTGGGNYIIEYNIVRSRLVAHIPSTSDLSAEVDGYDLSRPYGLIYENNDYPTPVDTLTRFINDFAISGEGDKPTPAIGDIGSVTVSDPTVSGTEANNSRGYTFLRVIYPFTRSPALVMKYDGPNGFTYKDW